MSMSKRRFRAVVLAAVGVVALLLFFRRGPSVREGGDGPGAARGAELRAAAAPVRSGAASAQVSAATAPARRPALRGTYRRGEGGHVRIEIAHELSRLPVGPDPARIDHAERLGARGRVTLRVVDPAGHPVAGAQAAGAFSWSGSSGLDWDIQGETDGNGEIAMENRACLDDLVFEVRKPGYYRTTKGQVFRKEEVVAGAGLRVVR